MWLRDDFFNDGVDDDWCFKIVWWWWLCLLWWWRLIITLVMLRKLSSLQKCWEKSCIWSYICWLWKRWRFLFGQVHLKNDLCFEKCRLRNYRSDIWFRYCLVIYGLLVDMSTLYNDNLMISNDYSSKIWWVNYLQLPTDSSIIYHKLDHW